MSDSKGGNCWHCGVELGPLDYGRQDICKKCGRDTRVCKGCIFYDRGSNNDCREPQADRVVDKEKSNFCDYFKPSTGGGTGAPTRDALKSAAEALFKKK
ncbi:MAG TPA: hypothetical protein VL588_00330 [Bdellovibrionota bacterium]|nr:hypothetical protein [Bdellovibrionota bacterium]